MIARYVAINGGLELTGTEHEFDFLSKQLQIDGAQIILEHENLDQFPHIRNLDFIRIKHSSEHLVKISVVDNYLLIEGSLDKLMILSESVETDGHEIKDYHVHIEYHDDHFYLSPESTPIVIRYI